MIRPSNVNIENHTANFKCDEHLGEVSGINVNTQLTYTSNNRGIEVSGSLLTEPCGCVSTHPNESDNIIEVKAQLAQAKTE